MKFVLLALFFISIFSTSKANEYDYFVDVIAIEYPPFTSGNHADNGVAFNLLKELTLEENISWIPLIVPPKRAYKLIEEGNWCASFFPAFGVQSYRQYKLGDTNVNIGLIRLALNNPFKWDSLTELKGQTLAILRTGSNSDFAKQFSESGVQLMFVENIESALNMVLLNRLDLAVMDNITYSRLPDNIKSRLQFSANVIFSTPVSIYINSNCNIPELNLPIIEK